MDSRTRLVAPVLVAAAICSWQSAHACGGVTAYSGRATVVNAQANLLKSSTKVVVADTGEIDPTGATRDATVVTFDNPAPTEVHSQTLSAVASGDNDVSAASAAVQKLVIKAHGVTIKADLIEADSEARCHEDSMTVSTAGMANLVNLTINGKGITWNHKVNDKRTLIGIGTLIMNEQTHPDVNTISVNAIHLIIPGVAGVAGADIVISHAQSGILTCPCL
ncbi:MAG TPA: choice-of-anchor P family protein [Nevskiaceae bacterium]|nr:choice-of-anchor P family protein [Nevskiaceae bacterium]